MTRLGSLLATVAFAFLVLGPLAHGGDPLFDQMRGSWKAEGLRTQSVSGRKTRLLAAADSEVRGDKLVSRNVITEIPLDEHGQPGTPTKTYRREYWIRAAVGHEAVGEYELGIGEGANEIVTSRGHFDGNTFSVEQNLGGEPPYRIESVTVFRGETSEYQETGWYGTKALHRSRMDYSRR